MNYLIIRTNSQYTHLASIQNLNQRIMVQLKESIDEGSNTSATTKNNQQP